MASHGLDWERLSARNPKLVMTSITPFGLTGPHAHYRATDLVLWNAGGVAVLNGDPAHPELPPLKAFGDQAGFQAG
jgi:crotonobetainyl-CoA:carnitine CoA-transferase CaiB-like acyl-CoA transferase